MKSIARKTKDNSGATIIMALLFMLVCVMVASILLATAGTASRDVSSQRNQQKAYLAVSSAMNLMRDEIENSTFSKDCDPDDPDSLYYKKPGNAPALEILGTALGDAQKGITTKKSFVLKCENVEDVTVKFSMTPKCRITVSCTAESEGVSYSMTAEFKRINCGSGYTWIMDSVDKGDKMR